MGWCSVRTCKRNSRTAKREGKNLKFFGPPLDPEIRKQWIIRCDRKDNKDLLSRRVCSVHFKIDDFEDGLQARLLNFEPKRLKKSAIPSLELPPEVQERISDRTKRMQVRERKEIIEVLLKEECEDEDSISKRKEEELHEIVPITDMEIKTCCIRGCRNTSSELLMDFYPFLSICVPSNWIIAYCKKNLTLAMDRAWICSAHFKEEAFITEVTDSDFVRTLTNGVVPTLNLPDDLEIYEKCARIKEENKELERSITEEELAIKDLEKLTTKGKAELNRINKELEKESVKVDIKQERELLSKVFSKSQIRVLSGRSKTHWKDDEMAVAYTIRHLSNDRAYLYLQTKLNIPLPGLSSIRKWINHKGDTQISTTNER